MADQPPPKKIGSLRDRIAAFEKQSTTQQASPPAPRPKPVGVSWKPKQPSPPSSPSSKDVERESNVVSAGRLGGMSAADAKESIGQGGSLRERMAALQGKGAFGPSSPPTAPPKPTSDKPKWKPPPQPVSSPSPIIEKDQPDFESTPTEVPTVSEAIESTNDAEADPEDPEEEERQRRAAIAARLQRIGGSKIGMGVPGFVPKLAVKKHTLPKEEDSKVADEGSDMSVQLPANPLKGEGERRSSSDSISSNQGPDTTPSAHISPEATLSASPDINAGSKSPHMPVPAVPRRVAPPRRKPGKSHSPAPAASLSPVIGSDEPISDESIPSVQPDADSDKIPSFTDDRGGNEEGTEMESDIPTVKDEETSHVDLGIRYTNEPAHVEIEHLVDETPYRPAHPPFEDLSEHTEAKNFVDDQRMEGSFPDYGEDQHELTVDMQSVAAQEKEIEKLAGNEQLEDALQDDPIQSSESPSAEKSETQSEREENDDDDSATRRSRIVERLAKSGGINPLAAGGAPTSPIGRFQTSPTASRKDSMDPSDGPPSRHTSIDVSPSKTSIDASSAAARAVEKEGEDTEGQLQEETEQGPSSYRNSSYQKQEEDEVELRPSEQRTTSIPQPPPLPKNRPAVPAGQPREAYFQDTDQHTQLSEGHDFAGSVHLHGNTEELYPPPPPPKRNTLPPPSPPFSRASVHEVVDAEDNGVATPLAPMRRRSLLRPPPPPPIVPRPHPSDFEEAANEPPEPVITQSELFFVPPPPPPLLASEMAAATGSHEPSSDSSYVEEEGDDSFELPVHHSTDETPQNVPDHSQPEHEILDDSDCDPIDPGFLSPPKRITSPLAPLSPTNNEPLTPTSKQNSQLALTQEEEEEEHARKRRLADRMAKLGGIKFGAPPLVRGPPTVPSHDDTFRKGPDISENQELSKDEDEEDEQVRRQRIAAKLAGMGGMRFGMLPPSVPGGPSLGSSTASSARPPHSFEVESISEDEGVKVEAEESEMEEVTYEDIEEEVPPPATFREARPPVSPSEGMQRLSSHPSGARPPVPLATTFVRKPSIRKASTDSTTSYHAPPRVVPSQSEYVMVEEPVGSEGPPPPPRPTRVPQPPRSVPPPVPTSPVDTSDSLTISQWELPSIPSASLDLGVSGDLSLSTWSEDSTSYHSNAARSPSPPVVRKARPVSQGDGTLSADQLATIWGRVGVQICEVATESHEKSRKSLIGDGTYLGFLNAVLSKVPNALPFDLDSSSFGYLIYAQTGSSVQKRTADIMPGDIVMLQDAKLKGHKGLQSYHQNVGEGEPLLGIIGEFDPKKLKLRVFQANQHVGHQTVESVSYRLEDMKSGTVKVFRVLES